MTRTGNKNAKKTPSSPESIGHAVRSQGSHHYEFLQGAFPFPFLRKRLFLWTLRLNQLLPALRRAFNVPIQTTEIIGETHRLIKHKGVQVVIEISLTIISLQIRKIQKSWIYVHTCTLTALHAEFERKSRGLT